MFATSSIINQNIITVRDNTSIKDAYIRCSFVNINTIQST